ncbi:MAG TPA: PEP-CTERM sorting domain-containing protein [Lacipirellulaceae bacterium]|nr:PEP-CTERM sorting domain-containing protein [Lacipirellulaceae bacterium]
MKPIILSNHTGYVSQIVCACLTAVFASSAAAQADIQYAVTDLGAFGPLNVYASSSGVSINANGQITSEYLSSSEATLWSPIAPNGTSGTAFGLGTLAGSDSQGLSINASGQVVGISALGGGDHHAFVWNPTAPNGTNGAMHDLGTLGGSFSAATSINASGQVVGASNGHAFLWNPTTANSASGMMFDLDAFGGSQATGINAGGQVAGITAVSPTVQHGFLWTPTTPNDASGSMADLGTLGGDQGSFAYAINDAGQVTGHSYTTGNAEFHAFLYDGTMHDLGTLGGTISEGFGINNAGEVVGATFDANGMLAYRYTVGTGMVDLNSLIDPNSGWHLFEADAINDAGQIAGTGVIRGEAHMFLLTAVPEPSTVPLASIGFVGLLGYRQRRSA